MSGLPAPKQKEEIGMSAPEKKTIFCFITALVVALGVISYLLADRYLIEHVEIADVSAVAAAAAATDTAPQSSAAVPAPTVLSEGTAPTAAVMADDWNYQSESVSIAIQKVSTGSGKNTVTYFVADVVLNDATQLASAFAKNQFGANIIDETSQIAADHNAIFAVNGDYYGFRSDGIVIRNGVIYRDEPARVGLAFFSDGSMKIYDETQTSAQQLLEQGVWNTLSFGPALIENSLVSTGFKNVNVDTNLGNHSIQNANPRTGVGVIDKDHFVFVVVDGRSSGYSRGVSLSEFAEIFKQLGCSDAYNIDGGGSSTLYFMGRVVNNPLGKNRERGTSDILFIAE